ncbi:MAG: outer membrane beta-barrel protein [Polyangiaceae bacterium]
MPRRPFRTFLSLLVLLAAIPSTAGARLREASPDDAPEGETDRTSDAQSDADDDDDDTRPLDVREPPFSRGDFSWMNGTNRQPESLLRVGPVVFSLVVDGYFLWSFHRPIDHTAYPSTTAPRHNELSLNMASVGIELPPNAIDSRAGGPVGQFALQYGSMGETNFGQDRSLGRGFYLTKAAFLPIRTASAGWHFHALHGINLEVGIFPSYIALESYVPQENWNYLHPFVSDFTPYYFSGIRAQAYTSERTKLELWVVNGWQTFGQWHEGRAGGALLNVRPSDRLSLTSTVYVGQEAPFDAKSVRAYTDNYAQWLYWKKDSGFVRRLALCAVADVGYEYRSDGTPDGWRFGSSLTHRIEFPAHVGFTVRGDVYYDPSQTLVTSFPVESPYTRPFAADPFLGGGVTTTLDYWPSPWLLTRLEYMHRQASIPFFSGAGGITGPGGVLPADVAASTFVPDLRKHDDRVVANVTLRL